MHGLEQAVRHEMVHGEYESRKLNSAAVSHCRHVHYTIVPDAEPEASCDRDVAVAGLICES